MGRVIDKRGCVPRTDAVVLEIDFADLGLPRCPRRTYILKGFALHMVAPRTADGKFPLVHIHYNFSSADILRETPMKKATPKRIAFCL